MKHVSMVSSNEYTLALQTRNAQPQRPKFVPFQYCKYNDPNIITLIH